MMADYPTALELAEVAYKGYAANTGGKTFDGRDMPAWTELPDRTVQAWISAVVAIHVETGFTMQLDEAAPSVQPRAVVHSITVTDPAGTVTQIHPPVSGNVTRVEFG